MLAALFAALSLSAQSIKVDAPNLVSVGERLRITFSIDGEAAPTDFNWEVGEGFKLVWGPQKGSSTSISIVNGNTTKKTSTSYTYLLEATVAGEHSIPPATATINGSSVKSGSVTIDVVASGSEPAAQSSGRSSEQGSKAGTDSGAPVSNEDVFLRLTFSKNTAVVGETITANLKLYTTSSGVSGFEEVKFPTFNGFWSQATYTPSNISFRREKLGNKLYNTATLRSWSLIPQKSGTIEIEPAELVCLLNVQQRNQPTGNIFDDFFMDEYRTVRKRVSTGFGKVHVSPLPAGAPSSFGGGVGNFSMTASLSRDSLKVHEAASLVVSVTGNGNIALLSAPKINFPPDFEVYEVKTTDGTRSKTFEFPFIPRSSGDFTIGPVEYSYYDISAGKYVTLRSAAMPLKVEKGEESAVSSNTGGRLVQEARQKEVKALGSDIRYISTSEPKLSGAVSFFIFSPSFLALLALLVLAALVFFFMYRRLESRRADVAGSRNRGASKMARKRLSAAEKYLQKNLYTAFYEELHRTLLGFVSDKFNLDAADQSKENIRARFIGNGASEQVSDRFIALLDACEFARYAPDAGHDAMNAHYEEAVNVISEIDTSMKRKHNAGGVVAALLLMMLPAHGLFAAEAADSLWNAGVQAYSEARWNDAGDSWEAILDTGATSPELLYNIGNACFKQGDYGLAILNYERALKLDPSYSNARFNLEYANTLIQDKIEVVPEFFVVPLARRLCRMLPSNVWAWLALVFAAGLLAMLLVFLLSSRSGARKTGFFCGLAFLALMCLSMWFASWQKREFTAADEAVVVSPVALVKSSPSSADATDRFILHEGTKVKVLDCVGDWYDIQRLDGEQGWIERSAIVII